MMRTTRHEDWELFTSTILLVSSAALIAREEIDGLIASGTMGRRNVDQLKRARRGVAALASIADHYEENR